MVMTPLAISPPSSTPEPDMSSIPQDAATIPHSATPQVLTGRTQNTPKPHIRRIKDLFVSYNPVLVCFKTHDRHFSPLVFSLYQFVSTSTNRPTQAPTWTGRRSSSSLITSDRTGPPWCSSRPSKAASTAPSSRKQCSPSSHKATGEKKYQVLYKDLPQVLLSICSVAFFNHFT